MHELLNNLFSPFLLSLLVALGIGMIVGMEREFDILAGNEHFAGLRAFMLMSVLGCALAFLSVNFSASLLLAVAPAMILFVSVFHFSKSKEKNFGLVTEISLMLVFFLGILAGLNYHKESLAVAVVVSAALTLKKKFRETIKRITQEELYAFVKFILLAFLLLPFLPDKNYGPGDILNLRTIGMVIVITSSLSFAGYLIIKFFGAEKGILFTAFFGGTFSSTALTWVYSNRSKQNENLSLQYAAGIILACAVMLIRVLVIAGLFNMHVFRWLFVPCLLMILANAVVVFFLRRKIASKAHETESPIQLGNPLELLNALLFGLQYAAITLFIYYANIYLGAKGLFLSGFFSGLADVDAINISVSRLGQTEITASTAAVVILLAIMSNTFFKMGEAWFRGSSQLKKQVLRGLLPSIAVLICCIVFIYWQSR